MNAKWTRTLDLTRPAADWPRQVRRWLAAWRGVDPLRPFGRIREQRGMTLERAAILAGCSVSHLRAVERGRAPLSMAMAAALARAYGCSMSDIARPPRRS